MRVQLLVPILVLVLGPIASAQDADAHRVAVDAWLDQREEADPAELIKLIGDDLVTLEQLLRAGRVTYPEPAVERATLARRPVTCEHVDYETEMLLYVPRTYDPAQPTSLVLIGHGGNGAMTAGRAVWAARGGIEPWIDEAERRGWILAAPLTSRGWGAIGNSILLTVISDLQRELNIDPDRIYVTGMSMGGHLSWRSGIWLGDRWGAVAPMSGGYDYVESEAVCLLVNVPGYAIWGTREPYGIAGFNRKIRDWMTAHNFDWVNVQKKGGHQIYLDEIQKAADFFAARPRDLYPAVVYARGVRSLCWDDPGNSTKWEREHTWDPGRPIPRSTFHWVRLLPRDEAEEDPSIDQRVWAVNEGGNRLVLTTSGVQRLRLLLHPRMVDLARPVTVVVNGEVVHEGVVEPDARTMLELVQEFDDRARIYHAALELTIDSEAEVPPPVRPD
jgi:hypothetical protein